jgi:hypothetical protein
VCFFHCSLSSLLCWNEMTLIKRLYVLALSVYEYKSLPRYVWYDKLFHLSPSMLSLNENEYTLRKRGSCWERDQVVDKEERVSCRHLPYLLLSIFHSCLLLFLGKMAIKEREREREIFSTSITPHFVHHNKKFLLVSSSS